MTPTQLLKWFKYLRHRCY